MEWFKKVLNPLVILFGVIIVLIVKLEQSKQEIMKLESRQPIIIYQVDNAGTEMFGKVTAKDVIDGHYHVEVKPYGKFLVTKEQYEEIEIGQEMPEYLKGRKQ
ncbi:DUF1372 family protein [Streptococcus suis]|nr:DUF1372 family protein [Streptococcus suis]